MKQIKYIQHFQSWAEEFTFFHPIIVRFSETDMFGHLNNTVPFTYFEEARIEFFKSKGIMQTWIQPESETIPVVADLQCDFLQQVYFAERINIYVKAESIGNSSIDIHYMGKKTDGTICFVGRGTMVQISKKKGKSVPWSEITKALLQENKQEDKLGN